MYIHHSVPHNLGQNFKIFSGHTNLGVHIPDANEEYCISVGRPRQDIACEYGSGCQAPKE